MTGDHLRVVGRVTAARHAGTDTESHSPPRSRSIDQALRPNQSPRASRKSITLLKKRSELCFLLGDPVGRTGLICGAGVGCGLFNEFADVLSDRSDARVEFDESCSVGHWDLLFLEVY